MSESLALVGLAVLLSTTIVAYGIGVLWWLRLLARNPNGADPAATHRWNGAVFECKPVSDRIQQVRNNYLEATGGRTNDKSQRKERVAKARNVVCSRSYFRHVEPDWPDRIAETPSR